MNLYRAIKNCSAYWFARIILEERNLGAQAFSSGIHPEERRAIQIRNQRRSYWRLRAQGLNGSEAAAKLWGISIAEYRQRVHKRTMLRKARYGGHPTEGTEAYNRFVLAAK